MLYATISLTANTLGSIALFFLFRAYGLMPHLGIAVATTLGGWLNAALLYSTLAKRDHFVADRRLRRTLPRIVISSALMGVVLWLVADALGTRFGAPTPPLVRVGALAGLVGAGFVTYLLAVFATGALDRQQLQRFLSRRVPSGPI
jgi:putative peptidoglycan lipid II flippase